MPSIPLRPDGTLQAGAWSIVGPPGLSMHEALSDDDDTTYVEINQPAVLDSEVAKLTIQDIDIPDAAKIFIVRQRWRVQKIAATPENPDPPTPRPQCGFHRRTFIAGLICLIFRILFGFRCPKKPPPKPTEPPEPPEWVWMELPFYTEQPGGGEWTEQSFNDFYITMERLDDDDVELRVSEVILDLEYNEQPVVTPNGPVGPLTDITLPTITWDYADPESDKQQRYRVRTFDEATFTLPNFDPATSPAFDETGAGLTDGWVKGEDNFWTVGRDHPNGTWRAYVIAEQVWAGLGNHRSEWAYWEWVQAVPGPPEPSLTGEYEEDLNRVRVDMHVGGTTPPTSKYNVEYSDNDGVTWTVHRDGLQISIDEDENARLYDYEAPLNRTRRYRAQAFRILNSVLVGSGFSNTIAIHPLTEHWWLKDPLVPALNLVVVVMDINEQRTRLLGVFSPLPSDKNRQARKVVISGPQYGWEGKVKFGFFPDGDGAETAWEAFQLIHDPGRTLLFQYLNGTQRYVRFGNMGQPRWVTRGKDTRFREVELDWWEVDPPWTPGQGSAR